MTATRILRCRVGKYQGHLVRYSAIIAERLLKSGRAEEPEPGEVCDGQKAEVATTPNPKSRQA